MDRLSMNELTTYRWSFEEDVHNYAAAGIEAIGVWRQKLSDFGEEKGIELLRDCGLTVSNLLWAGGFTGSDGRSFRESVDDASDAIALAGDMGSPTLILYSGGRGGHTRNHARRLLIGALKELAPVAQQHDVTLALEPMHPGCAAEWTFLTTLDETLEIVSLAGNSRVKLAFDTYHLGHSEELLDRVGQFAESVAIVHIADSKQPPVQDQNRCPIGDGQIPLREFVGRLAAAGYDGYFDVELMGEEIEASDYHELLRRSKEAWEQLLAPA